MSHRLGHNDVVAFVERMSLPTGTPIDVARVAAPRMGLVVAPDIMGLRPLFADLIARLADDWQMSVAAVEPFPGHHFGEGLDERFAAIGALDDDRHLDDLLSAADVLETPVVGLIGFCMGGMYCFKAARHERFQRIASFYGMIKIPEAWRGGRHREPLACLITGYADRVLAVIGGDDPYTPLADVDELRSTGATVVEYPDAGHGFAHDASRPSHRADDAADAFGRAQRWLLSALS